MRFRRALAWIAVAMLPLAALGFGYFWFLDQANALPAEPVMPTDAIIVLTGGAARVEAGLRLLEAGAAPRLLVSGAAPRLTLAELARATGRDPAALAGRVDLGRAAATTVGNAAEVAAYARAHALRSARIVTAGYHMPRALLEIRRAAPGLALVPHPIRREIPPGRARTLLPGEYLKYLAAAAGLSRLVPAGESGRR